MAHIKQAYRELENKIPWLCDNMNNDLKHALGDRPNSEFILNSKGEIVVLRDWSRPDSLRKDLEKLVGRTGTTTLPKDLNLNREWVKPIYPKDVVQRPIIPRGLKPVTVKPQSNATPFYAKLRVEIEPSVLGKGSGKVYLGFHLDRIHQVHWNNLAAPLSYEITGISAKKISPVKGQFPKVQVESDIDPREFILEAKDLHAAESFNIKVHYFACSDTEGWCKPVSQEYFVQLEPDKDGGSARRSGAGRPRQVPGEKGRPGNQTPRGFSVNRLMAYDSDQDGKVSFAELPAPLRRRFNRADRNGDKAIDRDEANMIEARMKRFSGQ